MPDFQVIFTDGKGTVLQANTIEADDLDAAIDDVDSLLVSPLHATAVQIAMIEGMKS